VFASSYGGVALDSGSNPSIAVSPAAVSPPACTFNTTAFSLVAGTAFTLVVTAYDSYGNVVAGDTHWTAALSGGASLSCPVTEIGGGLYGASCTPLVATSYTFNFFYKGVALSSTTSVSVTPGSVSGTNSKFGGFVSTMATNTSGTLYIYTYDSYNNQGGTFTTYQKFQTQIQLLQNGLVVEVCLVPLHS